MKTPYVTKHISQQIQEVEQIPNKINLKNPHQDKSQSIFYKTKGRSKGGRDRGGKKMEGRKEKRKGGRS